MGEFEIEGLEFASARLALDKERLGEALEATKRFLETRWLEWHREVADIEARIEAFTEGETSARRVPHPPSVGMEAPTARFLCRHLRDEVGGRWTVYAGLVYGKGRWHEHVWVARKGVLIDFTGDQFGLAPILAAPTTDPRYEESQAESDVVRRQEGRDRKRVEAWLRKWRDSPPT